MHPCAHCLLGFETLEIIEFRNREGVDYGLGRPQYVPTPPCWRGCILGDGRIHQFCIRSGEREEFRFAKEHTDFHPFTFEGLEETVQELARKQVPVYFTIDLDCLDPSVFPGTGTPEAGGVSFLELLAAIRKVSELNIVGADVNELAPMLDPSGVSTATACKVVRELLLAVAK